MRPELLDIKLPPSIDKAGQAITQAADAVRSLAAKADVILDQLQESAIAAAWQQGFLLGALSAAVLILIVAFWRRP